MNESCKHFLEAVVKGVGGKLEEASVWAKTKSGAMCKGARDKSLVAEYNSFWRACATRSEHDECRVFSCHPRRKFFAVRFREESIQQSRPDGYHVRHHGFKQYGPSLGGHDDVCPRISYFSLKGVSWVGGIQRHHSRASLEHGKHGDGRPGRLVETHRNKGLGADAQVKQVLSQAVCQSVHLLVREVGVPPSDCLCLRTQRHLSLNHAVHAVCGGGRHVGVPGPNSLLGCRMDGVKLHDGCFGVL